jgi:glucan endo-1,3-alpha-glucosidase
VSLWNPDIEAKLPDLNSDAFALNVGREDWQMKQVANCYATALNLGTNFKLFLSFDMRLAFYLVCWPLACAVSNTLALFPAPYQE